MQQPLQTVEKAMLQEKPPLARGLSAKLTGGETTENILRFG